MVRHPPIKNPPKLISELKPNFLETQMTTFNFKSVRHTVFDAYGTLFDVHSATLDIKRDLSACSGSFNNLEN